MSEELEQHGAAVEVGKRLRLGLRQVLEHRRRQLVARTGDLGRGPRGGDVEREDDEGEEREQGSLHGADYGSRTSVVGAPPGRPDGVYP